ncbi:NAD(P)-dependent dehydrogenase, short-chain alcohol dehydrogenase family [Actinopolyspora lacussalsi subsp. righensis]|uniref:NAD(P)-dependent dehydrogenase, short-chain alcohol dehydrogenase family n=1 Tax=Actinopolyspora righensis TaxID=995060 RepID=A0A1I6XHN4_9ACTN|nr:SDR family NAD(P)-dependent oxidoreductase [Actinopolyspora righensis]SFT37666.1 NAD(P)-dependent dehydrogenase, short-chain alcohol dehydrogenase family [Actinopolyspora righensis]
MSGTGLEGRCVVVTGAGSGIGRAAALRFASEGARVLIADLDVEGASTTEQLIREQEGTATTVIGDLGERTVVDEIVSTAVERFGGPDVLVNNAGIMDSFAAVADLTDAEWERVLRVNLSAPFLLTRAALPHMLAKGSGVVVNTASEASLRGSAAGAAYTSAKHGVVGLTKSLAVMYRDSGIRANAIAPGGTATGITVDADPEALGPNVLGSYGKNIGRVADADEQASAIVFLASDAASNVSGVVLPVDNGWSAV